MTVYISVYLKLYTWKKYFFMRLREAAESKRATSRKKMRARSSLLSYYTRGKTSWKKAAAADITSTRTSWNREHKIDRCVDMRTMVARTHQQIHAYMFFVMYGTAMCMCRVRFLANRKKQPQLLFIIKRATTETGIEFTSAHRISDIAHKSSLFIFIYFSPLVIIE